MASFGHFIKTEREKREWTQTELEQKSELIQVLLVELKTVLKNLANLNSNHSLLYSN